MENEAHRRITCAGGLRFSNHQSSIINLQSPSPWLVPRSPRSGLFADPLEESGEFGSLAEFGKRGVERFERSIRERGVNHSVALRADQFHVFACSTSRFGQAMVFGEPGAGESATTKSTRYWLDVLHMLKMIHLSPLGSRRFRHSRQRVPS